MIRSAIPGQAAQPVARAAPQVGDGKDDDTVRLDDVSDREWEARQQEPTDAATLDDPRPERPGRRALDDGIQGALYFVGEVEAKPGNL